MDALTDAKEHADRGLVAVGGGLDGRGVVVVGTGVGKVNAATAAALAIDRFGCRALLLSGVAGGLRKDLAIGDLVAARRVIDIDYGRWTDAGRVLYQPGSLPLAEVTPEPGYRLAHQLEVRLRARVETFDEPVRLGTLLSGDAFLASPSVRDELAARWSGLAIEMEAAGVCGVSERFGVPWLVVRALSDRAGEGSSGDFGAFLASAAVRSARLVRHLLPVLAETG